MCKVWILEFGDFGFWGFWILGILDFGFWGSWILDFGLGILDWHLVTKFWMLHKKRRLCTPNRVGGLRYDSDKTYLKLYHIQPSHTSLGFSIASVSQYFEQLFVSYTGDRSVSLAHDLSPGRPRSTSRCSCLQLPLGSGRSIWMFPKIVVPPNHPF